MRIASIGMDLGKNTFHLVALGERNKVLLRKKFSRSETIIFIRGLEDVPERTVWAVCCSSRGTKCD